MKLLRKSCLSGQLPASDRAEGTALSAGADAAQRPGRARREREDAEARGGTGMGSAETERRRCPARPGLPQGADEAVDRALRVQGHDVPYVEEAGHFIRHAASCSKVDVLPLLCALAALSREPPPQGLNGAHGCNAKSGGGGHGPSDRVSGSVLPRAGRAGQERRRSRRHPATCAARAPQEPPPPPPRQVSCSFQKFSLQHLCSSSSSHLLLAPSLLCALP